MSKKKQLVTRIGKIDATTSLVVADGVGLSHATIIKVIRRYENDFREFGFFGFEIQKKRGTQGLKTEIAVLNEDQATYLITLLRNNEIVRAFKIRLVKAFRAATNRLKAIEHQAPDWQESRKVVSILQRSMTDKLMTARALAGKPTHAHHYLNENLLLTFALVGKAKPPIERSSLDTEGLKRLAQVEDLNGSLILSGLPYEQRKDICRNFVVATEKTHLIGVAA
jgi:phage regulator Rha-like protein